MLHRSRLRKEGRCQFVILSASLSNQRATRLQPWQYLPLSTTAHNLCKFCVSRERPGSSPVRQSRRCSLLSTKKYTKNGYFLRFSHKKFNNYIRFYATQLCIINIIYHTFFCDFWSWYSLCKNTLIQFIIINIYEELYFNFKEPLIQGESDHPYQMYSE